MVTRELERGRDGKNLSLKVLSRSASEEDVRSFIEMAEKLTTQGDRANVDAILQVSVSANYELYEKMKRRDPLMCEAMRRLMKDEMKEAQKDGEMKAKRETAFELADMGLPVEKIAKAVKVSLETVQKWLSGNVNRGQAL